jgi:hypothetical protein
MPAEGERMPDHIVIEFDEHSIGFDLDHETCTWTTDDPEMTETREEGDYPLIASAAGKRYELYSDGRFAEVEV